MSSVNGGIWATEEFAPLSKKAMDVKKVHLRELLMDTPRNQQLFVEWNDVALDMSRQKVDSETFALLMKMCQSAKLKEKIDAMFAGEIINTTEGRPVGHVALRSTANQMTMGGKNVTPEVVGVLNHIEDFTNAVRKGEFKGHTGKALTDVVCVGIGGSYLGPEFVYEALRTEPEALKAASGRKLRFLANVDPVDFRRAVEGLHPETTLVVVVSKTFTTAETMMNADTMKTWLLDTLKTEEAIGRHMVAVSTATELTTKYGINQSNVFGFWDWVGGRYSVTSAVGVLPIALHYGFPIASQFLKGAHDMDIHFKTASPDENLPILMGLISVWNTSFLGYGTVAVLPYSQCLLRFAAHVQQLAMESNGKRVSIDGKPLPDDVGQCFFGEPGTNGQHSFYQLLHQGRVIPAEFIGVCESHITKNGSAAYAHVNHDELMANFFAQPDALAFGKTITQLKSEGVKSELLPHKEFPGDRPSLSLLFRKADAYSIGTLLALYEHRTIVEGFLWSINSFDQWGVELGKVLAGVVKKYFAATRSNQNTDDATFCGPTKTLMRKYLSST